MRTGFNMLLWTTHVTDTHAAILEDLARTGYDGVEIPIFEGEPSHYAALGRRLDGLGLSRTGLAIIPSVDTNPVSDDAAVRQAALRHLDWALACTGELGATLLCGPLHSTLGHFSGAAPTEVERRRCVDFHQACGDIAARRGIMVVVEALNRFECYLLTTMADLARHLDAVAHPNVSGMFDTFHANIEERDPVGCIAPAIRHIRHVHVSENDRGTPGRGHVDLAGTLAALKRAGYDGYLTIEAFGRALPDLAAATRIWRDVFSTPEDVYRTGFRTIRDAWAAA